MDDHMMPAELAGLFDWRSNGFHVRPEASRQLLQPQALDSPNPWVVMAAVVERAKQGDRSRLAVLSDMWPDQGTYALSRTALLLIGDLGNDETLTELQRAMASDDAEVRMNACSGAALSGRLWLVPSMVEAWKNATTQHDHEMIGYSIAELLEPGEYGPLSDAAGKYPPRMPKDPRLAAAKARFAHAMGEEVFQFPALAQQAYSALKDAHGTDRVTVWHGDLFSVHALASSILEIVTTKKDVSLFDRRHRLGANTGLDCRGFFQGNDKNFLNIAAALEELLESGELERYEVGARYFFGHPVV